MGDVTTMLLVGGHPAVDFVNTLGGRPDAPDDEYLHDYGDLLTWSHRSGMLPPGRVDGLAAVARNDPAAAAGVLSSASGLRAALDAVLRASLGGRTPAADDVATVGRAFGRATSHGRLSWTDAGLRWTWADADPADLSTPLWPVAASALDLLDRTPLDLLGRCHHCRWLFLDTSRNHTRRWCSMNACGGTDKMRRHRARLRSAAPSPAQN